MKKIFYWFVQLSKIRKNESNFSDPFSGQCLLMNLDLWIDEFDKNGNIKFFQFFYLSSLSFIFIFVETSLHSDWHCPNILRYLFHFQSNGIEEWGCGILRIKCCRTFSGSKKSTSFHSSIIPRIFFFMF